MHTADEVDDLLKARIKIDKQLRRHKNALTVLFTDVVGSTSFFERNGDTAGLVMIHRHHELATRAIQQHNGKVIKTIGDSAMAEFPNPKSAVRAAVEIERQFLKLNLTLPEYQRVEVRIGVHTGVGFRNGALTADDFVLLKRGGDIDILVAVPGAIFHPNHFSGGLDEHFGVAGNFGGKNHREVQLGTSFEIIADREIDALA